MTGLGDLAGLMGKVRQMQQQMQQMQEQRRQMTVQASSGGGMVSATVNGAGELVELKIDPSVVDTQDIEMLEDLIKAAVNAANEKSQQQLKDEMLKMTGGLNIPGLDQLGQMLR